MARQFDVEYDDFTGGYFVGPKANKQPANTWRGDNIAVTPGQGYLVATPQPESTTWLTGLTLLNEPVATGHYSLGNHPEVIADTGSHIRRIEWTPPPGSATTITSVAHAAQTGGLTWPDDSDVFLEYVLIAVNAATMVAYNVATAAVNIVALPATFVCVRTYKNWAVGFGFPSNRLYFSNPNDPLTWSASNYIDVAAATSMLLGAVEMNDALYLSTASGWWQITGVLGETSVLRKVDEQVSGGSLMSSGNSVLAIRSLYETIGVAGGALDRLSGSIVTPEAHLPGTATFKALQPFGHAPVIVMSDNSVWYRDMRFGTGWQHRTVASGIDVRPVRTAYPYMTYTDYAILWDDVGADVVLHRFEVSPNQPMPVPAGTSFPSASVTLAEYTAKSKFKVDKVLVELDLGTTSINATRSIGLSIKTPGELLDVGTTVAGNSARTSSTQTVTLPSASSTAGEKVWVEFNVNDGGPTYAMEPVLTLQGVKVARVIVRCQEIG